MASSSRSSSASWRARSSCRPSCSASSPTSTSSSTCPPTSTRCSTRARSSSADVEKVRAKAFETFKGGPGRELAGLLSEHKAGLRDKRALLRKLGTEVNATKHQIDELKELLERKQELRVAGADVGGGGGGGGSAAQPRNRKSWKEDSAPRPRSR